MRGPARLATAAEARSRRARSAQVYGGYPTYQRRITAARLRIFVLEPLRLEEDR